MFSHIMVGTNNMERAQQFYDKTLGVFGYKAGVIDNKGRCFYRTKTGIFGLTKPIDGQPSTHANGGTIGFYATSPEQVDAWHKEGLNNGGQACEDPPGPRTNSFGELYVAYLRDPDGNKICALCQR